MGTWGRWARGRSAVRARRAVCAAVLACLVLAGCSGGHRSTPPSPHAAATATRPADSPTPASSDTPARPTVTPGPPIQQIAELAAGKVLVQAQCAACHALADAGIAPAPSPVARPLDGIGAAHGRAWLLDELRNACAHVQPLHRAYPCRQMHAFASGLTPAQRDQVVAYLLSLR